MGERRGNWQEGRRRKEGVGEMRGKERMARDDNRKLRKKGTVVPGGTSKGIWKREYMSEWMGQ